MSSTHLVDILLLPPGGPLLLAMAGLLLHRRRLGKALLAGGVLGLYLLSLPITANLLSATVQRYPPIGAERWVGAGAIVLLAGDLYRGAPEYGDDAVGPISLMRARYAARLARLSGLPVLASGGVKNTRDGGQQTEAELLSDLLIDDFGLTEVFVESSSQTTWENARFSARWLQDRDIVRVVLVTYAAHMARAVTAFESHGIQAVAAPTAFFPTEPEPANFYSWLPSVAALWRNHYALHELLGGFWYRVARLRATR